MERRKKSMKQNVISFISTIKNEILGLNTFLYNNPENCFNEYKASMYIKNLLKKYNFSVDDNFENIPTSFYAKSGNGHPYVCFICKYSSSEEEGHIFGNNCNAAISIGASIALTSVIEKIGGSVVIIGCPGKYSNGSEIIMTHDKVFEEMDVIFAPHVDNSNAESGTSMAMVPVKINYEFSSKQQENPFKKTALDGCLYTMSFINDIVKQSCNECYIDHLCIEADNNVRELPSRATAKFEIKSKNILHSENIEKSIRTYVKAIQPLININYNINLYELPCKELITNKTLSRIFSNNLKECGIIEIEGPKNVLYPLGIGTVSHTTPTIYPSISIVEDNSISCPSEEFKKATISTFAEDRIIKAVEALSITGIDFIERKDLIDEITRELNKGLSL
jgi:metal-dependent amidase/aminoacylase/carboxypeptidase family protein